MTRKSHAVVQFLANLMPIYVGEDHDGIWCARSLQDGTLVFPVDESGESEERGTVTVRWQGDPARTSEVDGAFLAALALERFVRLHGVGASEDAIAAELRHLARHFEVKTGCEVYLPSLAEPSRNGGAMGRIGEGLLVNAISKITGLG